MSRFLTGGNMKASWMVSGLFKSSFAPLRHCPFTFPCHISWSLVNVVVKSTSLIVLVPQQRCVNVKMAKFPAEREMQRSGASWSHEISGDNKTVSFHSTFPWGTNELYIEFFSVLLFWHPEKKRLRKDISILQKEKLGFRGVKWIVLDHFSFRDFLASVNNRQSACTSHTHDKHTPLSTTP